MITSANERRLDMVIDCKKKACPQPVVLSLQALRQISTGESLEVIVDNMAAVENLTRMAEEKLCDLEIAEGDGIWTLKLTKRGESAYQADAKTEALEYCDIESLPKKNEIVIAIGTDVMGQGDEKLGKNLLKGYIYALNQLEDADLPAKLLFFNGGAYMTTEGAETINDLKDLKERGVEIYTCGACLDFYGIKEKLLVGEITNMYSICEYMIRADKVIRI